MTEIDQKALEAAKAVALDYIARKSADVTPSDRAVLSTAFGLLVESYLAATTSNAAETAKPVGYTRPDRLEILAACGPPPSYLNLVIVKEPTLSATAPLYAAHQPLSTSSGEDEAYELGKRDGYEEAVQDIDVATGGDGEFKGSTFPGETVDVPVMKQRVIDRLYPNASSGEDRAAIVEELVGAAQNVYARLCGEATTVTILDQERLGDAIRALKASHHG